MNFARKLRMRKLSGLFIVLFFSCSVNNITEDKSLSQFFEYNHYNGTFAMFNNINGEFTIYNIERYRDSAYTPGSTFDIVTSLIGIETGRVKDSTELISRNGDTAKFRQLAQRIGKDTMQHWLDTLGYGQRYTKPVITNNLDSFWFDNSVTITADEQLGLVKKLYFGQLPFQARSQRIVKNLMLKEDNANYKLSYATGKGHTTEGARIGWIIGWIEENRHPYFFVYQVEALIRDNWEYEVIREDLLKEILRRYGFLEGKR